MHTLNDSDCVVMTAVKLWAKYVIDGNLIISVKADCVMIHLSIHLKLYEYLIVRPAETHRIMTETAVMVKR